MVKGREPEALRQTQVTQARKQGNNRVTASEVIQ